VLPVRPASPGGSARVALSETVKFVPEGETKFILMGDDGKEYTLELLKRTARATDTELPAH
jgi:hypothetical protein